MLPKWVLFTGAHFFVLVIYNFFVYDPVLSNGIIRKIDVLMIV